MHAAASLSQCLQVQRRVLHALLMRQIITRFGRENLGVLWLVGEPMLFTLGVTTLWSATGMNHGSALPIVAFAVTGYSSVLLWRNAVSRAGAAVEANKSLLYHRNVQVIDVIASTIVIEIGGATCSFMTLSGLFIFVGWMPVPADLLLVAAGWIMLAWFGAALALLIGASASFSPLVERLWHPLAYLVFPLSGAAFMVDWLPARYQSIVLLLPMVDGVELLRQGYFGDLVHTHYDVGYMALVSLVLSLGGLYMAREAGRRLEM
jgi:ABC-type polysaccharide/polyol phosphate export permease